MMGAWVGGWAGGWGGWVDGWGGWRPPYGGLRGSPAGGLTGRTGRRCGPPGFESHPLNNAPPPGKLDWVLLRGCRAVSRRMGNDDYSASDHKWLQVEVELGLPA